MRSGALAHGGLLVPARETALGCEVAGTVDALGAGVTADGRQREALLALAA
jgi:NADPH:quinone reductase-like Zn-dependent oxidoreductase